jgi:hypothetical protein
MVFPLKLSEQLSEQKIVGVGFKPALFLSFASLRLCVFALTLLAFILLIALKSRNLSKQMSQIGRFSGL